MLLTNICTVCNVQLAVKSTHMSIFHSTDVHVRHVIYLAQLFTFIHIQLKYYGGGYGYINFIYSTVHVPH